MTSSISSSSSSYSLSSCFIGSKSSDKDCKRQKKTIPNPSLPLDLPSKLPQRHSPWLISDSLFKRLKFKGGETETYHKTLVSQEDPEWAFVHTYFNHSPPRNRRIEAIYCLHNPDLTNQFEAQLPLAEKEGQNPSFAPNLDKETLRELREKRIRRWEEAANLFSPIVWHPHKRDKKELKHVKIIPFFQGTTAKACDSISKTGFTFFGTHHYDKGGKGDGSSTDIGFFGNGIYFTNSARYSLEYAEKNTTQHVMLAWVAMREPYPVVSDRNPSSEEDEPADKTCLKGKGPYKNYNAHFIPVAPIRGISKKNIYYPCTLEREPWWDEVVVFQKAQTLPRFWIQIAVDLPSFPSPTSSQSSPFYTIKDLLLKFSPLGREPAIKEHKLYFLFKRLYQEIAGLPPHSLLSPRHQAIYRALPFLLDSSGIVEEFIVNCLAYIPSSLPLLPTSSSSLTIEDLLFRFVHLDKEPAIKEHKFYPLFKQLYGDFSKLPSHVLLPPQGMMVYNSLLLLLGPSGTVDEFIVECLAEALLPESGSSLSLAPLSLTDTSPPTFYSGTAWKRFSEDIG